MTTLTLKDASRIKLLSADVASKIAAGEVVERPASVLKELMENSIDSGATQVDVTIERGGIQLLKVRDNGSGILQQDLSLALQQHATSKISNANDLANIVSLGFRGEALASINSVAKVTITSQTAQQPHAWSISGDQLIAAAHPLGTTVHMTDLFYNVPVRRKFLRSERTEYIYLEEVFRRIALSNFDIGFSLTNHGKLVKSLPPCMDHASRTRRLINLCGQQILNHASTIDAEQNGMRLWGWLGTASQARSQEPHQYFFINKRVIKDRLINHAIRQVYQPLCADGKMPFYCLYLEVDTISLDVNVHPTKHEVRFRDPRVVHAFLSQIISEALGEIATKNISFQPQPLKNLATDVKNLVINSVSKLLCVMNDKIIIAQHNDKLLLVDVLAAQKYLLLQQIKQQHGSIALELPVTILLDQSFNFCKPFSDWCQTLDFILDLIGPQKLLLRAVPLKLQRYHLHAQKLLQALYEMWKNDAAACDSHVIIVECVNFSEECNDHEAQQLLAQLENMPCDGWGKELSVLELQEYCR